MRQIRKILFITLSNIGDCILTLPVLDAVKARYPDADVTVLSGPRPRELFESNPAVRDLVIYDKHSSAGAKIRLAFDLAGRKFDMAVDMRNSLLSFLLPGAIRICRLMPRRHGIRHMRDIHLDKAARLRIPGAGVPPSVSLAVPDTDRQAAAAMLKEAGVGDSEPVVIVSAGARSAIKRWEKDRFAALIDKLINSYQVRVVLIGDKEDRPIGEFIVQACRNAIIDLTGLTTFSQSAALLRRAKLLITNDSANLHAASYLNIPVVAVFGPTDDMKYGPWGPRRAVAKKEIFCRPCCEAQCRLGTFACMHLVTVEDVFRKACRFLSGDPVPAGDQSEFPATPAAAYKRILIVRTDRMGDMILSTPVLKAMRRAYPCAYIAVLVRPYTRAVVEGNPFIDEVVVYDKKKYDSSLFRFLGFVNMLRRRRFDLALVLHPTVRDHLIVFLSCIRKRVGYARKMGFLLTDRLVHDKQLGAKHESEYALDLVRTLGIEPRDKEFFVPVNLRAEQWVDNLFRTAGIKPDERVV
ncbi:MAG: glycosyltransferase family 9 protein, partial [Candidatus Omnitrophota bacterium]